MDWQHMNQKVVFSAPGVAHLECTELPAPQAGQVLVRTRATLISPGTERAFFLGLPNTTQEYPQFTGYSNIGEIAACGPDVADYPLGMRVASASHHAQYAIVDADKCLSLPKTSTAGSLSDETSSDEASSDEIVTFFNLTSIALQGVRKARIELGESVVVIGAGLIGLLAIQLAKLSGALPVIAVDLDTRRLQFARTVGADATVQANEDATHQVAALCGSEGATTVIEATGNPQAILTAFSLASKHGRVILLGSTRGETEQVNFYRDIHKKGITVIGAHDIARPQFESSPAWWTQHDDQQIALKLLTQGRLSVTPLITHRFAWQDAARAYDLLKMRKPEALGIILNWSHLA